MKRKLYLTPEVLTVGAVSLSILNDSPYKQSTVAADLQEEADGVELGSNKTSLWEEEMVDRFEI